MKKYYYVTVSDRNFAPPIIFDTVVEAQKKMREDFVYFCDKDDRLDVIKEEADIDLRVDGYGEYEDCGIDEMSAWVNETYNHANWDAAIFEV